MFPCGKTLGHGETCAEGHLCDQCRVLQTLLNRHERAVSLLNEAANALGPEHEGLSGEITETLHRWNK